MKQLLLGFLKGKWLGHPLHPALVHIPVALWPAALLFDVLSRAGMGGNLLVRLSFYAIAVGLATALLAVPTGLVDWSSIKREKPAWKIGLYHMIINGIVILLSAANLGTRVSHFRAATEVNGVGLWFSVAATVLLLVGGYLGGLMVFDHGISVARFSKDKWRAMAMTGGANVPEQKQG